MFQLSSFKELPQPSHAADENGLTPASLPSRQVAHDGRESRHLARLPLDSLLLHQPVNYGRESVLFTLRLAKELS